MAELQGEHRVLEPKRVSCGVRDLLPFEAQLCDLLEITPEEYFYFQALTDAYNGTRPAGYELVPDVRNDPISIIISIVVGAALTAAATLLAPKPKAPQVQAAQAPQQQQQDQAPQLATANITGASRFSTNTGFDSVQQLASLGETIPLVFANKSGEVGGIRVKTLLLWSQLVSQRIGQELKAVMLLCSAQLAADPDFQGFAIGDQTLKNYTSARLGLYRRLNGGRLLESDRYPEGTIYASSASDAFSVFDDISETQKPWFSGTRSPSTQTQFGCFNPMPNATPYRLQYELVLRPDAEPRDGRIIDDVNRKRNKLNRDYATRAAFTSKSSTGCVYTITGGQEDQNAYAPWGLDDVNASVEDRRIVADDQLQLGGLYMAGAAQVVCIGSSSDDIWELGSTKSYQFRIEEPGDIAVYADPDTVSNTNYGLILQRVSVGTVANNRQCDITELGIKSIVWKQLAGFPNVNSQPDGGTIEYYQHKNGSIQLGSINRYHRRISFFRLEIRPLGTAQGGWTDLSDGRIFAVEGSTPQAHYNYFRVKHTRGQYEFRFLPYPGGAVVQNWLNRDVWFIGGSKMQRFNKDDYLVTFNGYLKSLTPDVITNPDWVVGRTPPPAQGIILSISPRTVGPGRPTETYTVTWRETRRNCRYSPASDLRGNYNGGNGWVDLERGGHTTYWDGRAVGGAGGSDGGWNIGGYGKGGKREEGYKYDAKNRKIPTWRGYEVCRDEYIDHTETRTRDKQPILTQTVNLVSERGSGGTVTVQVWENGHREYSLASGGLGYNPGQQPTVTDSQGVTQAFVITTDASNYTDSSLNIYDAVADIQKYDAERMSHLDGPEHQVVYVNEQLIQDAPQYEGLALLGLRLNASKEWSSFAQLSAYIQKGIVVERLIDDAGQPTTSLEGPTNNFAEIAYALLTNERFGAGMMVGKEAVDRERMTIAARYCHANGFTWDGIVASPQNLREFLFENAGHALLDFTVLGGQFSLMPSVTYNPKTFEIDSTRAIELKALFTDGNIRGLKVNWMGPEERQLFKAVVKYRVEQLNGFSEERVITVRLSAAQGGSDNDQEEVFDMSGFCTQRSHALTFARFALKLRKEVDHSVQFETTPASAIGLEPGQHFRLMSEATHTSRFNNGAIGPDGHIISTTTLPDGLHSVLYWLPGTTEVKEAEIEVKAGQCLNPALNGSVFTLANTTTSSRVYKVETLEINDDGFVQVTASYEPVLGGMQMATLDWPIDHFVIEESR